MDTGIPFRRQPFESRSVDVDSHDIVAGDPGGKVNGHIRRPLEADMLAVRAELGIKVSRPPRPVGHRLNVAAICRKSWFCSIHAAQCDTALCRGPGSDPPGLSS